MRSVKKFIAILVIICIALNGVYFQALASSISEDAQICRDLGMLLGAGEGVTSDYLASSCTRLQGAVLLLR